jgi:hypothetical protein
LETVIYQIVDFERISYFCSMSTNTKILHRSLAFIFGFVFIAIAALIFISFLNPKGKVNESSQVFNQPIDKVWKVISDKRIYLDSKPEIAKYNIYDTVLPRWVEYYTPQDSVENKSSKSIANKQFVYTTVNRKYEQINGFNITLDSIAPTKTKVSIKEFSRYLNTSAGMYFQLFKPTAVLDYEFAKINHTLQYLDSNIVE